MHNNQQFPLMRLSKHNPSVFQGCLKLAFQGTPDRGGDSLSLQFQAQSAQSAWDKLSPPRKGELDAALKNPQEAGCRLSA